MPLTELNLDTLKDLAGGQVAVAFQRLVNQAVKDCVDRPGDKRMRKITLQLSVAPVAQIFENTISCEGAKGTVQARLKLPDYETTTLDFGVQQNGRAVFSPESPQDHRQATMFEDDQ